MLDPKGARALMTAAERDIAALRDMGDASVFAEESCGIHTQQRSCSRLSWCYRAKPIR